MMKSLPALAAALLPDPFYQAITVEFAASNSARLRVLEAYFGYSMLEAQRTGRCVFAPREEDGAAYLETFTPRNLAFYRKLGFDTVAEYLEPVTNSSYVIMRRDA